MATIRRGAGTMRPPRPSTASLTRKVAASPATRPGNLIMRKKKQRPATAVRNRGSGDREPLGDATPRLNMARPSSSSRPRESTKSAAARLGSLYGMNSTSAFPKTRGGMIKKKKRPDTAPRQRQRAARLRAAELQEKKKHRYSFWRHDSSTLNKTIMLNNVNPSPRDPIADERSRRRNLHDVPWTVGYRNKLGAGKKGPPKVEFNAKTGEVRVLPAESKGWPLDSSMRQPWGPKRGPPEPWQPPLGSVPPGDWPKGPGDPESPRLHFPWSPPRRGSGTLEPMLGFDGNVRSPGQRKSILAKTTPQQYFEMKDEEQAMKTARSRAASARRHGAGAGRRPMTATASPGRRVQFMSSVRKASANRPGTAAAASPMRGRMQPKHKKRANTTVSGSRARPQSAAPSPSNRLRRTESAPKMHARQQRGQSATPTRSSGRRNEVSSPGSGGKRPQTAGAMRRASSAGNMSTTLSPAPSRGTTRGIRKTRPHTAVAAGHGRLSPGGGGRVRPHTAAAHGGRKSAKGTGGIRRSASGVPQYLRPTTATRTKQLYRTGQWPSGRWKMEQASHFVPLTNKERQKKFHVKHKHTLEEDENPNVVSSSSEDEDEDEAMNDAADAASLKREQNMARRKRDAQMRKRPMVAGQRKPRRRFEQKSLANFTVLRSAPLKKHHVHEVLGKKMAERKRRCSGRDVATAWMLAHPKFKALALARFWKQFKPLALENIEATMLLHRLRRSAAGDGSGGGGGGDVIEEDVDSVEGGVGSKEDGATTQVPGMFRQPTGMHIVDREPWINECPKYANMWISRPQFLHHIRILMSLNETHGNLRALNRLFSSFDVDVEDKMNIREFCVVMENLREERKRSVWAGKSDVNPVFEAAAARFRPRDQSSHSVLGRVSHHL